MDKRTLRFAPLLVLGLSLFPSSTWADDFIVNSADDSFNVQADICADGNGFCTLRAAIAVANRRIGNDNILFDIPGPPGSIHTIQLVGDLPPLADHGGVLVDATTQPGYAGLPLIEIDCSGAAGPAFELTVGHATLRGFNVHSCNSHGILIRSGHFSFVESCIIGTDRTGTVARPNTGYGIYVTGSSYDSIGGGSTRTGNLISGNALGGIYIDTFSLGTAVSGNLIGTDFSGALALSNGGSGIVLDGASNAFIGNQGSGNLISGNIGHGIEILGSTAIRNELLDNRIGTDSTGLRRVTNDGAGIFIDGAVDTRIGAAMAGNLVSGNSGPGIEIRGNTTGTQLHANVIGLASDGSPLGNQGDGIDILDASNSRIGAAGLGNTIAYNSGAGVGISSGVGNQLQANRIFDNDDLGIDLAGDSSVTANDSGDGDTGANQLQNFPVLGPVEADCVATRIDVTLASQPNQSYTIEFFVSPACDSSGHGEAESLVGSQSGTTDAAGRLVVQATVTTALANGSFVTATATDASGNTSELSACVAVVSSCIGACGDGNVGAGEQCDEGGNTPTCDADCTFPICGDGHTNPTIGESCDALGIDTPQCDADCTAPICGDGHLNTAAGETCDDGNQNDNDGCSSLCRLESCATGTLRAIAMLLAYKDSNGALRLTWIEDPLAAVHHLNWVSDKRNVPQAWRAPRGVGLGVCNAPVGSGGCTDPLPLGALRFYQVVSSCGLSGASEGPI